MAFDRSSGLLLHPTSFPSRFGVGDLGPEAYQFIDFLVAAKQRIWQILPLTPPGFGNSPYLAYSAEAGNPWLISPDRLCEAGLLAPEDFAGLPDFPLDYVDFDRVGEFKFPLLRKAFDNFKAHASEENRQAFDQFCQGKIWLDDFVLFMAIKHVRDGASWHTWEPELAQRKPDAMAKIREELADDIFYQKYLQFEFDRQWHDLKRYANERNIEIIGDLPFYVAHDSADVWAHPKNFCLDEKTGEPAMMAGVPPDYFSETGQLWGNPVYNWEYLKKHGFRWWLQRLQAELGRVDALRIDHFRGLSAYWAVEQGETTAMNGEWVDAPGEEMLDALRDRMGELPIVAEDLGIITPDVEALRDRFGFPGMKILHFAFDSGAGNPYLTHNYGNPNCIVYTGTHDNNTTVGWFEARAEEDRWRVLTYMGSMSPDNIHWQLIRLAFSSVANQAIVPFQDTLGLGGNARMNTPSEAEGNWTWRYRAEALSDSVIHQLVSLTELYGRG